MAATVLLGECAAVFSAGPALALAYEGWGPDQTILDDAQIDQIFGGLTSSAHGDLITWANMMDGPRRGYGVSHFSLDSGWGPLILIDDPNGGDAFRAAIDGTSDGTSVFVWSQGTSNTTGFYARWYTPDTGWGPIQELLADGTVFVNLVSVAVTEDGNATAVWNQRDFGALDNSTMMAREYAAGGGWGPARAIGATPSGGFVDNLAVEASVAGVAIAAWTEYTGPYGAVFVTVREGANGWTAPLRLDGPANVSSQYARLLADRAGNVMVVWPQEKPNIIDLMARRYTVAGGWENATSVEQDNTGDVLVVQTAIDSMGNIAAVWQADNGVETDIWLNKYTTGVGWGAASVIDPWDGVSAQWPNIAFRPNGDMVASFGYQGALSGVYVAAKRVGSPWESPAYVGGSDQGDHRRTLLAISDSGDITVLWIQPGLDGLFKTHANTFVAVPDTTPPFVGIIFPENGYTTEQSSVTVSGTTEPGAALQVNGLAVAVAYNGSFSVRIPLQVGKNRITATATDVAGNRGSQSVDVTYVDPADALARSLEQLLAILNSTQAGLNVSLEELELAKLQLNESAINQTGLEARVASLQTNLSRLEAVVADLSADLSEALENGSLQDQAISDLRARLGAAVVALEGSLNAEVQLGADIANVRANLTLSNAKLSDLDRDNDALRSDNDRLRADLGAVTVGALLGIVLSSAMSILLNIRSRRSTESRIEQLEARIDAASEHRLAVGPVPAPDLEIEALAPKPAAEPPPVPCPQCGMPVAQGTPWCVACGLDLTWN